MVAGKVKAVMGFQKSPGTPKPDLPRRSSSSPSSAKTPASNSGSKVTSTAFARSFGIYFPRSSAQVQPKPPDVSDLLRLIENLQEKESRLQSQLLEQKILKETVAIVPFLEKELASKTEELDRAKKTIEELQLDSESLRSKIQEMEEKMKELSAENQELRRNGESRRLTVEIEECSSSQRFQGLIDVSARSNLLKNLRKGPKAADIVVAHQVPKPEAAADKKEEVLEVSEMPKPKVPRIPKPPPLPSTSRKSTSSMSSSSSSSSSESTASSNEAAPVSRLPPPPPPPPPPPAAKGLKTAAASVRRVPEVVEFYHSLMRRDSKRESGSGVTDATSAANTRNMIGEIENRSAHLLAIKTDVETQGEFIRFLIKEVQNASFTNIEDLVAFVKWLDDELSYLVDERAVLKHFDWPEQKADAMREAAFGYCDLKKLVSESSSFRDNNVRQPCSSALKKMQALLEKLEHGLYDLSRVREGAAKRYKGFQIPWEWMMDTGFIIQIKLASVKLAMKYMKRVSSELEAVAGGPEEEELMLQGVRFAFRVHQFAGGFDVETMRAFQELRDKARSLQCQKQSHNQQQTLLTSSMSMSC